jgi:NADH-quinone oxidoreductase subunit L
VIFVTFTGSYRGPHPEHLDEHPEPPSMTIPLVILVIPTIISGLWGSPWLGNAFSAFVEGHGVETVFRPDVAGVSTLLALAGIGIAWQMYGNGRLSAGAQMTARFAPIYRLLMDRYHLDHLYGWLAGQVVVGIGWLASQFDRNVIDGIVNGIGHVAVAAGRGLRQVQSGQVQTYALVLFVGVLTLALVAAVWR